jgi:hypothetical protein
MRSRGIKLGPLEDIVMRKAFLEYLVNAGIIPATKLSMAQTMLRGAPEPIGSIAFGYGLISGSDIDDILDEQREKYRPFGEIAVSRSLLTQRQVDMLLLVQHLRAATEIAEALALAGVCPVEQIMSALGRFLARAETPALCAAG